MLNSYLRVYQWLSKHKAAQCKLYCAILILLFLC